MDVRDHLSEETARVPPMSCSNDRESERQRERERESERVRDPVERETERDRESPHLLEIVEADAAPDVRDPQFLGEHAHPDDHPADQHGNGHAGLDVVVPVPHKDTVRH